MMRRRVTAAVLAASLAGCVSVPSSTAGPSAVDRAVLAYDRLRPSAVLLIDRLPPTHAIAARLLLFGIEEALRAARGAPSAEQQEAELRRAAAAMTALVAAVR